METRDGGEISAGARHVQNDRTAETVADGGNPLEIISEINRRLLDDVRSRFPGNEEMVQSASVVEDTGGRKIRMANLAIVGSHSTNGVAAIHSELLRKTTVKDLATIFPERFRSNQR